MVATTSSARISSGLTWRYRHAGSSRRPSCRAPGDRAGPRPRWPMRHRRSPRANPVRRSGAGRRSTPADPHSCGRARPSRPRSGRPAGPLARVAPANGGARRCRLGARRGRPECWQEKPWLRCRSQGSPRRPAPNPTGDAMQGARSRPRDASSWHSTWTGDSGEESAGGAALTGAVGIEKPAEDQGLILSRIDHRLLLRQSFGGRSGVVVRLYQDPHATDVEHPHVPALAGALGPDVPKHGLVGEARTDVVRDLEIQVLPGKPCERDVNRGRSHRATDGRRGRSRGHRPSGRRGSSQRLSFLFLGQARIAVQPDHAVEPEEGLIGRPAVIDPYAKFFSFLQRLPRRRGVEGERDRSGARVLVVEAIGPERHHRVRHERRGRFRGRTRRRGRGRGRGRGRCGRGGGRRRTARSSLAPGQR